MPRKRKRVGLARKKPARKRSGKLRGGQARIRRRMLGFGSVLLLGVGTGLLQLSCASAPPREAHDLCSIFEEKRSWYKATRRSYEKWGISEPIQLAVIKQESSFRARARPERSKLLWIFPGPRPSSAYGYGQVLDGTWEIYRRETGRRGADRNDFADVADFIGWYGHRIHRQTGVHKSDTYGLYLAYHEGAGGYLRQSYAQKPELQGIARKVERQADRYGLQYETCRTRLERPWWRIL